jgi:DHA2 family multidrug resistance protein-like MFS transporter
MGHDGEGGRGRLPGLLAVLLGVAVITLDISLTSTALPAIANGLGASAESTIWIINVYYLAVVAALLPMGALGEIHGHRRVFLVGLLTFAAGALACGLAWSLPSLAVARAVLGLGSAAVSATTPGLIRTVYPPERLGRGLGLYALVVGVAFTVGPTAASAILSVLDWPWLFLGNLPIALLAFVLSVRNLPPTERHRRPFDGMAAALCAGMFALLLFAIAGAAHGTGWLPMALAGLAAAGCGYALWRREAGSPTPILAIDLFQTPVFALSAATSICAFAIQGLVFVALPILFQTGLGYSQVEAGFLITPWPVTLAVMTLVAAPMADRVSPGLLGGAGLLLVASGLAMLATLTPAAGVADIAWRLVLCGIGFGFFQSPNMKAIMTSAPRHRSGGAGGILATSRLLGQSVGAALVALCLHAFAADGLVAVLWLGAGLALCGSATSFLRTLPAVRGHG